MPKKSTNQIPSMETPWSRDPENNLPFAGSSVEAFLKRNIRNKVGCAKVVISADGQNDIIAGFENEAAYEAWNALSTENKWGEAGAQYLITYDTLPSPKKDSYAVSLVFRETPATTQASTDVSLALKGTSVVAWAAGGTDDIQEDLVVTVQTRASSSAAWSTRESFTLPANTQDYVIVSLARYLNNGMNYIRFRAEGEYATSLWSSFTLNVVALQLVPNTPFSVPFTGSVLSLNYLVGGSIAKTLQFEFGTGIGTTFEAEYSYLNNDPGCSRSLGTATNLTTGITFTFEDADMIADIMADGVHTVRARLFVSESVKTEWIESQYMVANGTVSPMVIVNNIASRLDNWTDVVFFDWAAHTAGQNEMTVIFRLVDSADDTVEYARWSQVAQGNVSYSLATQLGLEIADSSVESIYAYMYIEDANGNELAEPVFFTIGNEASNNPTAGADFILAPAARSNAEASPKTIINAATGEVIPSVWTGFGLTSDGWMEVQKDVDDATQGTVRSLHVPAGRKLTFEYDPLVNFRSGNSTGRSMTLEMDVRTDNILDEDEPILEICTTHPVDGDAYGIRLLPKEIYFLTQNNRVRDDQNATWAEGKRVHIAVNIVYGVQGLNWVRIFLDGRIERVFNYLVADNFAGGPVGIAIGNTSSDIDVFGMRCYQKALSTDEVMQDRKAAFSTVSEKIAFATRNNILGDGGAIDFAKAKELYNVIGLTGHLAKYGDSDKGKTKNNTLYVSKPTEPENAGTYTGIENSGQGTTAMTYNDWNQQQKPGSETTFIDDATETVTAVSDIYVAAGEYRAKKTCGKINFASSMQGHKMGLTRIYTELFKQLVSSGVMSSPGQFAQYPNARLTVFEEPYLFFHRETENDPWVFKYLMTWGAGKGDKPTFGFNKSKTPHMLMVEGADNDRELANFKIPWNDDITYSPDAEAWMYNGAKHINFGFGVTSEDETGEFPSDATAIDAMKAFFNFCYLHHRSVLYYSGTLSQLRADASADRTKAYWTTQADATLGAAQYDLFRWSAIDNTWVAAGVAKLGTAQYETLNIRTQYEAFGGSAAWTAGQWSVINAQFIAQRTAHFRAHASDVMHTDDALFHDCFVLFFAGTDNRAKNTYYYVDPVTLKVRWMQDDLDTVLKTNNVGQNRKPYYVELHDTNSAGNYFWQGEDNGLYNLLEAAFETERTTMMNNMLSGMASLGGSALGYLTSRVLQAQQYFPEIAYNEVTRLVYMQAQVDKAEGRYQHNTDPVTQACGSQYWSEYDWLKDRLMYISSWCEYGEFSSGTDSTGAFSFRGTTGTFSFVITPGKWMYPRIGSGSSNMAPSASGRVRVQAGQPFAYQPFVVTGDSPVFIKGIDYLLDIGDMNVPMDAGQGLTVPGKMLQRFRFNPDGTDTVLSAANAVTVTARNIKELTIRGLLTATGQLDISQCSRLESIDVRGSGFTVVSLPASEALATVHFPATLTRLTIDAQPGLQTIDFEGVDYLDTIYVDQAKAGQFDTGLLALNIYNAKVVSGDPLTSARFFNVNWTDVRANMLLYYASSDAVQMTGSVAMLPAASDRYMTFAEIQALIDRFGNIQSATNDLHVDYPKRTITSFNIRGVKYIKTLGEFNGWALNILPSNGNNVAIANGKEDVHWEFIGANASQAAAYASFTDAVRGVLNVIQLSDPALDLTFTIRVTMNLVGGTSIVFEKKVGFYNRIPKLGDFAFHDGTFDNELDMSKTLVGVVTKVTKVDDDNYDCEVYAKENATTVSSDGTLSTASPQWGVYPDSGGTNGFPSTVTDEMKTMCGVDSVTDTPVPNATSSGIPNAAGTSSDYRYVDGSFLDASKDDGYATIAGVGCAARFNGKNETAQIVGLAKTVIERYLMEKYPNNPDIKIPTTMEELGDAMLAVQAENASASSPTRYRQMLYPAAFSAYLYQPTVGDGEELHEQYRKNNWHLPAEGTLCRIYNFFLNSTNRVTYSNGGRISVDYANETPESEAVTPLFANLMKRIQAVTSTTPFLFPTNSYYWSSTENSTTVAWTVNFGSGLVNNTSKHNTSNVVRPVAVFRFTL